MMLIQSPDGEKVITDSLDGYDGWTVLADPVDMPTKYCTWCDGWQMDEEAKERAELVRLARDPKWLADTLADILASLPKEVE
jgi:hypothetical protein